MVTLNNMEKKITLTITDTESGHELNRDYSVAIEDGLVQNNADWGEVVSKMLEILLIDLIDKEF